MGIMRYLKEDQNFSPSAQVEYFIKIVIVYWSWPFKVQKEINREEKEEFEAANSSKNSCYA